MNNMFKTKYNKFILAISYTNYVNSSGGTNKVMLAHQKLFEEEHISYVQIFPYFISMPRIDKTFFSHWGITIDGNTDQGVYTYKDIILILCNILIASDILEIHIHHLMNINIKQLSMIIDNFKTPIKFYIHDYYTMCIQYNLLKNDIDFCGIGPISENKCKDCKYYRLSKRYINKIEKFLEIYSNKISFIAPSDIAKKIWISAYPNYKEQVKIIYHQTLVGKYYGNNNLIKKEDSVKIAYVGNQSTNKGWCSWKYAISKAYISNCNERFYFFGQVKENIPYVKNVIVNFTSNNINAMVNALRNENIDVVVLWSIWPETYAYTYFESLAANTFIITNKISGNIAYMVNKNQNGIILNNEEQLAQLLCDEKKIRFLVNEFRKTKNYGPADLLENKKILSLVSNHSKKNKLPFQKVKVFCLFKRKFLTITYNLYTYIKKNIRRGKPV